MSFEKFTKIAIRLADMNKQSYSEHCPYFYFCPLFTLRLMVLCISGNTQKCVVTLSLANSLCVHSSAVDDKKLQLSLKKLGVNTIPGIEEVNMIKNDGTVIHFNNPKTQASLATNTFAITGHSETKQITEMLPNILQVNFFSINFLYIEDKQWNF